MMPMMSPYGGVTGLLLLVLLLIMLVALAAWLTASTRPQIRTGPDEELLRMRYARGEIGTDEYQTRLAALRSTAGVPR